jgi:serine protease inhibitor ecotin
MNHQNSFRKLKRFKTLAIPVVLIFDKFRVLQALIPLINKIARISGIKKEFNTRLNYRIYAESFENAFSSTNKAIKNPKKVVFFFTMGSESSYLLRQLIIANYLETRNWKVEFLFCSGFTTACNKERIGKSRENTPLLCTECSWGYSYIHEKTKVPITFLKKQSLDSDEIERINQLTSVQDCISFVLSDNTPIGELTKVNVLRYFYQGSFTNSENELKIYKKYLLGTYQAVKSIENYFSTASADLLLFQNGSGNLDQSMIYFAQKKSINYITQESFIGSNSWIYKKNGIAIHLDFINEWKKNNAILTDNQLNELHQFLLKIKKGEIYNTKLQESEIGILNLKKGVALFTNMNFDTYVLGRNSLFSSMENWLIETIEFWKENVKDVPLYIRIHPGETKMATPAVKFTREIVKPFLDENIILIDSDSDINSYSLVLNSHYIITYSSTIGVEAMMMDIPCVSAGEAFYKPFALTTKTKHKYFEALEELNKNKSYFKIQKNELESYLYYLYFTRISHFKGFDINRKKAKIELSELENFKVLVDKNKDILDKFYMDCITNE